MSADCLPGVGWGHGEPLPGFALPQPLGLRFHSRLKSAELSAAPDSFQLIEEETEGPSGPLSQSWGCGVGGRISIHDSEP